MAMLICKSMKIDFDPRTGGRLAVLTGSLRLLQSACRGCGCTTCSRWRCGTGACTGRTGRRAPWSRAGAGRASSALTAALRRRRAAPTSAARCCTPSTSPWTCACTTPRDSRRSPVRTACAPTQLSVCLYISLIFQGLNLQRDFSNWAWMANSESIKNREKFSKEIRQRF